MTARAPEETGPGPRLLLVEDYFVVAEVYRSLLGSMGFEVAGPAASVETALEILEGTQVVGAVLDVILQGMPVSPVARRLRELGRPFIFLTATANLEVLSEDILLLGMPVVQKPASAEELAKALRKVGLPPPGTSSAADRR